MGPWEKRKEMSLQYKDKAEYKKDSVLLGEAKGTGGSSQGSREESEENRLGFSQSLHFLRPVRCRFQDI